MRRCESGNSQTVIGERNRNQRRDYQMAESMVNHAMEMNTELENAQKLKQYLDMRKQVKSQVHDTDGTVSVPGDGTHGRSVQQD